MSTLSDTHGNDFDSKIYNKPLYNGGEAAWNYLLLSVIKEKPSHFRVHAHNPQHIITFIIPAAGGGEEERENLLNELVHNKLKMNFPQLDFA